MSIDSRHELIGGHKNCGKGAIVPKLCGSVAVRTVLPRKWCLVMQRTRTRPIILLVEDYADSRQMLKLLLEGLDYIVLTAATGAEAVSAAANNDVDLLLSDFSLPDMTGPTVVRQVRQLSNRFASIPVIMLTAFDGYEYRQLAYEAGCDAFLIKPPDFEILQRTIDRLLQKGRPEIHANELNSCKRSDSSTELLQW